MKPQMNEPNWPTTILPSTLAIIGNSSCCSRMPGDMAVLNNTVSISKRALRKALSMISMVTVSTSTVLNGVGLRWMIFAGMFGSSKGSATQRVVSFRIDQNVAEVVHEAVVCREDDCCGVHFHHDGGPLQDVTGGQLASLIHRGGDFLAVHIGRLRPN